MDRIVLGAGDYAVFGAMLAVSLGIGIYFGIRDRRAKRGVQHYLMGGRKMSFWTVGVSLSFSVITPATILGIPSEIYIFGSMFFWMLLVPLLVGIVVTQIYIPLYFRVSITSSYEYLQLRFSAPVRILGTLAYITQTTLFMGVMIYAPSLAFAQVSGFNLWAAIFTTGIVCSIYTTLGGLKGVMLTHVFQGILIVLILIIVLFTSASSVGGWYKVWLANYETDRFTFNDFSLDPRVRHSAWSVTVGLTIMWTSVFATTQSQVQRFLVCTSAKDAKLAMITCAAIVTFVLLLCMVLGWVTYSYFHNCDPLSMKQATSSDQLLPLMVLSMFHGNPGFTGAFMAAVFACSLSPVSAGINALSCVTVEDLIRPFVNWSDRTLTISAKVMVFFYGILSIGFACLSTILGNILQTTLTLLSIVGGPTLGMYTLGAMFPPANSWGSFSGFFVGISLVSWIYAGSRDHPPPLQQFWKPRHLSTTNCTLANDSPLYNSSTILSSKISTISVTEISSAFDVVDHSTTSTSSVLRPTVADVYAVSYAYYAAIGFAATTVAGLLISLLTCGHRHVGEIDPKLIVPVFDHPLIKYCLPKGFRMIMWCGVDHNQSNTAEASDLERKSPDLEKGHSNPALEMTDNAFVLAHLEK
ncbi:sodium-coupled monocarboxylate transporter 2-like isoform X1 [Styela clava]